MTIIIYGLIDPRDSRIRYIGKTSKPLSHRFRLHVWEALRYPGTRYVRSWIRKLDNLNLRPNPVSLIELSDGDDWAFHERRLIAQYKKDLVNLSDGGECSDYSATRRKEVGRKISEKLKGRVFSEETKRKMALAKLGKPRPESVTIKIAAFMHGKPSRMKGKKQSEKFIALARARMIGNKYSVGRTDMIGNKNALGCIRSEETKKKMALAKLGKPKSEEAKKKMSEARLLWWSQRQYRAKLAAMQEGVTTSGNT